MLMNLKAKEVKACSSNPTDRRYWHDKL